MSQRFCDSQERNNTKPCSRRKAKRLYEAAEEWILEQGHDWIFSFENICGALGFNPEYVRRGLLRWKEKKLPKHSDAKVWEGKMAG